MRERGFLHLLRPVVVHRLHSRQGTAGFDAGCCSPRRIQAGNRTSFSGGRFDGELDPGRPRRRRTVGGLL